MTLKDKPTLENGNFGPVKSRRLEFKHICERGLVFQCHMYWVVQVELRRPRV